MFSVLTALSVAVGLALPDAGQDAEAQGISVLAGYSYTQRYCQELGRQPRFYNVRDPIPGSDWRNDGGWAIVLIRSATYRNETRISFSGVSSQGGSNSAAGALGQANSLLTGPGTLRSFGGVYFLRVGDLIVANHGAYAGKQGLVGNFSTYVIVDRNKDGQITTADMYTPGNNLWYYERADHSQTTINVNYGGTYIRWANMLWCR